MKKKYKKITIESDDFTLEAMYIMIRHIINKESAERFAKLNKLKIGEK